MAQGYIRETRNEDKETIGEFYFQSLAMRSLFQDFEVKSLLDGENTYCKMHDMVHDFATSLVEKESRLNVEKTMYSTSSLKRLGKLRSFSVHSSSSDSSSIAVSLPRIFDELTSLRSLSLRGCHVLEIPSRISKLIHLRLLDLSHIENLKKLHENVCKLCNLQTLNVDWCQDLRKLPKGLGTLVNLRHLHNVQTLCLLPKGIGRIVGLKRLDRVNVDLANEEAFSLKDLKNLNSISGSMDIRWLKINGDYVEDAKQAHLKEKKNIIGLGLLFPPSSAEYLYPKLEQYDELLEELFDESRTFLELVEVVNPPPSLERLRIHNYMGKTSPSWINSLACLKMLQLSNWSNCKHFPPLRKLPCLEFDLNFFDRVREVGVEFLGINESIPYVNVSVFPKLTNLKLTSMYEWQEWKDYDGDGKIMPVLESLTLIECEKLKALPNFILQPRTPFLQIRIGHCDQLKV